MDGCPAGCAVCWDSAFVLPVLSRAGLVRRTLLAARRRLPTKAVISMRSRNLGTELPYGSGMAYGRCDRVLDSIYPPSHTSPGWVGVHWTSPQKKASNGTLHNSVTGDSCINLSLSRRVHGAVLARRRQLARYHLNVTDGEARAIARPPA